MLSRSSMESRASARSKRMTMDLTRLKNEIEEKKILLSLPVKDDVDAYENDLDIQTKRWWKGVPREISCFNLLCRVEFEELFQKVKTAYYIKLKKAKNILKMKTTEVDQTTLFRARLDNILAESCAVKGDERIKCTLRISGRKWENSTKDDWYIHFLEVGEHLMLLVWTFHVQYGPFVDVKSDMSSTEVEECNENNAITQFKEYLSDMLDASACHLLELFYAYNDVSGGDMYPLLSKWRLFYGFLLLCEWIPCVAETTTADTYCFVKEIENKVRQKIQDEWPGLVGE